MLLGLALAALLILPAGLAAPRTRTPALCAWPTRASKARSTSARARASAAKAVDPAAGDVLKLEYALPRGPPPGRWAKAFPGGLDADRADVVRLAVRADSAGQARQVAARGGDQGDGGRPAHPRPGRGRVESREVFVDWPAVGQLKEVVVSVNPVAGAEAAAGTAYLDVQFDRLSAVRRLSTHPAGRMGGVLAARRARGGRRRRWRAAGRRRRIRGGHPWPGRGRRARRTSSAGRGSSSSPPWRWPFTTSAGSGGWRSAGSRPGRRGRRGGGGGVVKYGPHRQAPDAGRGLPGPARDRAARGLRQPAGDPAGAGDLVRDAAR